jgi:HlyD family secretion protein
VDEADIGEVTEGQRVEFTVDAYIGETFNGVVTQVRLDPTVTSNVVTYTVVIKADNEDLKLKPGLTATISIYTLELNNVLTAQAKAINFKPDAATLATYNMHHNLPETTVSTSSKVKTLWVLGKDRSISEKTVTLGASDGVNVQVLSGISEGEALVYSLKGVSKSEGNPNGGGTSESPFMPQRPGSKKK